MFYLARYKDAYTKIVQKKRQKIKRNISLFPLLRSRKYFFRLLLRAALIPKYGSGSNSASESSSYRNKYLVLFYK